MHPTKRRDLYFCIAGISFVNFLLFFTISQYLGGTASEIKNGHYYLNEHGRRTEVSSAVYHYSQIHTWLTFPIQAIGIWAFARAHRLRRELEEYDPVTTRSI